MTTQKNKDMNIELDNLSLATAFLAKTDDAEWSIVWQNKAAIGLWSNHDLNTDVELRLLSLDAVTRKTPSSFVHKIEGSIDPFRFILTPVDDSKQYDLMVQFFPETTAVDQVKVNGQENIYKLIVESSYYGVLDLSLTDRTIKYSEKTYQILDISHALLGNQFETLIERIHPDDRSAFNDGLDMHFSTKWPFNVTFRFRASDGNTLWVNATGRAIWDENTGEVTRFIASLENISDRIFAEEQLNEREKLIEQIIDSLPISIYVKDERGCYRFFSRQTETETGVDKHKAIGKTDYEIFSIDAARKQVMQDEVAREEGRIVISEESVQVNGGEKWLMMGRGPITVKSDGQETTWVLGFSIDITHQKAVEQMLRLAKDDAEKATRVKSEFLSVMSHEIRTPLNSVIGSAQLILETQLDKEQAQHVEMIQRSGEHLLHLINDILDFNKLEADKMVLESAPFDLSQQAMTVVKMSRVNAEIKGVRVELEIEPSVTGYYLGDSARLRQIFLNLIGNAVKFTDEGSVRLKVSMTSKHKDVEHLRFEIIDTGIGIAPENIDKLFGKFTQADSSTTRKFGGTGLGLAICKKLVESMEGSIGIASELGKGSVFWFEIPLITCEKETVQSTDKQDVPELKRKLSILVAEDNPPNQLLIKAILSKLGHDVHIAVNGLKALEILQSTPFDLVLMDMQMPEMDGVQATREIRSLETELSQIPIVALTANALAGDRETVIECGMNDYLTKPIDISALKRTLNVWGAKDWR